MHALLHASINAIEHRFAVAIAPEWRIHRLQEERHLRRLLSYLDVDCVFDVGANIGQYAQMLRQYCDYNGLIISFEPNPDLLDSLSRTAAADPNWVIEPAALGKSPGRAVFKIMKSSELSSFRRLITERDDFPVPKDPVLREVDVDVTTLSEAMPRLQRQFGFRRPFLKMDTQGFEMEIFIGAGDAAQQFVGLQAEVAIESVYEGATGYQQTIECFERSGFILSALVPSLDLHFPKLYYIDCIMIRRDLVKTRNNSLRRQSDDLVADTHSSEPG
jgi:FkbM family methyltransferase